jgi:hypothetical protein
MFTLFKSILLKSILLTSALPKGILPMVRTCTHCGREYTYNPSNGNPGMLCKHCGWVQTR